MLIFLTSKNQEITFYLSFGSISRIVQNSLENELISAIFMPVFEPELALLVGLQVVSSKEGGGRTF